MKSSRPIVERQKRRYSLRLSLFRLRKGKSLPAQAIASNSEPWIENPRSLADAEAISDSVERSIGGLVPKMTAQEAVAFHCSKRRRLCSLAAWRLRLRPKRYRT